MEKSEILKLISDFLLSQNIMTLATYANNKPYCANLFYVVDKDLNIFFLSSLKTRHAQEIAQNNSVSITVYDPESEPGKFVAGIQAEGIITEAQGIDLVKNFTEYLKLFPATKLNIEMIKQVNFETRFFKFTPAKFYYQDKRLFPKRAEVSFN